MFMNDVNKQEEIRTIATQELKSLGVKYRYKKHRQHAQEMKSWKAFKTPLHLLPTRTVTLESGQQLPIPKIIQNLCTFVLTNVQTEGLFRKGGSKSRQNEIKLSLDAGCSLGDEHHEIDVASVLKTFFRELPEPLIPATYHELFLKCVLTDEQQRLNAVLTACLLLPIEHLNTLTYFMQFLHHVSSHHPLNKMTTFNLAVVFGPTLLPPDEKLVQSATSLRLSKTTELFLLLIENCQRIGALSERIISQIKLENKATDHKVDFGLVGDVGWDGDGSGEDLHGRRRDRKKKKRRSGSLTRIFSGLKKIVGGKETPQAQASQVTPDLLMTPIITRSSKKRKADGCGISEKNRREIINGLPQGTALGLPLLSTRTPVSKHPNVKKSTTPVPSTKAIAQTKTESTKEKKSQWYSRSKVTQKAIHDEAITKAPKLVLERRWSAVSQVAAFKRSKKRVSTANNTATVTSKQSNTRTNLAELRADCSLESADKDDNTSVEYVKISKNEYEEIKQRVSEIERRISIELDGGRDCNDAKRDSVINVQAVYEQTLADTDSLSPTTDQLAKRFSRDLKIRRSAEAKVIRSPSARKIGSLRRKSRDKQITGNKLNRHQSWHVASSSLNNNSTEKIIAHNVVPSSNNCTNICEPVIKHPVTRTSSLKTPDKHFSSNISHLSDKWTNAEGFFHNVNTRNVSYETCRASIAKIRSQNAGMVLAKARLFDNLIDSTDSLNNNNMTTSPPTCQATNRKHLAQQHPLLSCSTNVIHKIGAARERPSAYRVRALRDEQQQQHHRRERESKNVIASPGKKCRVSAQVVFHRSSPGVSGGTRALHRRMRLDLLKENAKNDVLMDRKQLTSTRLDSNVKPISPRTPRNMPRIKRSLSTRSPWKIQRTPTKVDYLKTPLKVFNTPITKKEDLLL